MPIPMAVARFNRRVTNHITRPFAAWLPGFAVVHHVGRRTGRAYRTPVDAFRASDGYVFALTYGADTDWVRNVVAAGGCEIRTRGRRVRLGEPTIEVDARCSAVPGPVRPILRALHVDHFLTMRAASASA
jgi:deazaflavin-dependent oxidoreductase (nitroreductase family)